MSVSVEAYFCVNFLMNALAISAIARSLGRVHWARVFSASGLGAVYAVLAQLKPLRFLGHWALVPCVAAILAFIALPFSSTKRYLGGVAALLGGGVFLGGIQLGLRNLFPPLSFPTFILGAVLGTLALTSFFSARRRKLVTWEVQVLLSFRGGQARFRALVDTGNRLREPFSGLPVMIVEQALLKDVLPSDWNLSLLPGFREVGYGALGGCGKLRCFRPEILLVNYGNGYLRAPDVWIAVYPGALSGSVRALAPPIIGCVESLGKDYFPFPDDEKKIPL